MKCFVLFVHSLELTASTSHKLIDCTLCKLLLMSLTFFLILAMLENKVNSMKKKPLMTQWLRRVSQGHEMSCHDLVVMALNPSSVELRGCNNSK